MGFDRLNGGGIMEANAARTLIRWLISNDIVDVVAADEHSFDYGWSADRWRECIRQRNCVGMVVEVEEHAVAGAMLYELHDTSIQLLRLCVHPKYRGRGLGIALLDKLKSKLLHQCRQSIFVDVDEYDVVAQRWLARHGFVAAPRGSEIRFTWTK